MLSERLTGVLAVLIGTLLGFGGMSACSSLRAVPEVVELNAPTELVRQISQHGWSGVGEKARAQLPDIAGERIFTLEDVRLAMLDRLPGEQVWLELERSDEDGDAMLVSMYVELI